MPEITIALVGTSFGGRAAAGAVAQMREGDEVRLERDPDNEHDQNAVAVRFLGLHVGYVPRKLNHDVARALDRGAAVTAICARPPEMRGDRVHKEPLLRVFWEDCA